MKDRMSGLALISMVLCWASPLAAQSLADTGEGYIIHAHDFDLEAVVALIEEDRVSDAAHLVDQVMVLDRRASAAERRGERLGGDRGGGGGMLGGLGRVLRREPSVVRERGPPLMRHTFC